MFVSSVDLCRWCAHLCRLCIFVSGVHISIWCTPLYLVCIFVSGVYLCIWCAHLYLLCTFVSDVHICIWCTPLYLVCTFVSDMCLCGGPWPKYRPKHRRRESVRMHLLCTFVCSVCFVHNLSGAHICTSCTPVLTVTPCLTPKLDSTVRSVRWSTCSLCLCRMLEQLCQTVWLRAPVTHYLNTISNTEVC